MPSQPKPPWLPPPTERMRFWVVCNFYDKFPSALKGSVRVAVAVTCLLVVGLSTHPLSPNEDDANVILRGFEWAAVTASLVPYNTIGEGGLVASAQVAATVMGGFTAYAFTLVAGGVGIAFIVGAFTLLFHVISWWLGLQVTLARIATATFVIGTVSVTAASAFMTCPFRLRCYAVMTRLD